MKKLIKQISLFSDGTFEEKIFEENENTPEISVHELLDEVFRTPAVSVRIKVNIAIFILSKTFYTFSPNDYFIKAVEMVANYQNVSRATVYDKIYRQLNITASGYKKLLQNAIENDKITDFKNFLKQFSGTRTFEDDNNLIDRIIV